MSALKISQALHRDATRNDFADVFIGNILVSMYVTCGHLVEAEEVFCEMFQCDDVSWNALPSAYVEQGEEKVVL